MKIEDPHGLVTEPRLRALCEALGLPEPEIVQAAPFSGRSLLYGLRFPVHTRRGGWFLRLDVVPHPRGVPLDHVHAAHRALGIQDEVPLRRDLQPVPTSLFGLPAIAMPFVEVSDGARLIQLQESFRAQVARDLGHVLSALSEHPMPDHGLRASDGRFVSDRGTWREAWLAYVASLHAVAGAGGLDLGDLSHRLRDVVLERQDALDDVSGFAIVHGELTARALKYRLSAGTATLHHVDEWDVALAGDPLVEAAFLVTVPAPMLGPILLARAHGDADVARAWLEPSALARIEAYHATFVLSRLADAAHHFARIRDPGVLWSVEPTRRVAEAAARPAWIGEHLADALGPKPSPYVPAPRDPARTAARVAALALRGDDPLSQAQATACLLALAAGHLAGRLAEPHRSALAELGVQLAPGGRTGVCTGTQRVADRTAWAAGLSAELVRSADGASGALVLWWLGLAVVDDLDGTVSDAVLRGLERAVRELGVVERREPPATTQHKLQLALATAAAAVALGQRPGADLASLGALRDACLGQLEGLLDLADPAVVHAPVTTFPVDEVLVALASGAPSGVRPLVALSLLTLRDRVTLPASATALLALAT